MIVVVFSHDKYQLIVLVVSFVGELKFMRKCISDMSFELCRTLKSFRSHGSEKNPAENSRFRKNAATLHGKLKISDSGFNRNPTPPSQGMMSSLRMTSSMSPQALLLVRLASARFGTNFVVSKLKGTVWNCTKDVSTRVFSYLSGLLGRVFAGHNTDDWLIVCVLS